MPNPRGLPAGRTVFGVAHDSVRDQLTFRGLGHVDQTGAAVVADDALVDPTLEILGGMVVDLGGSGLSTVTHDDGTFG